MTLLKKEFVAAGYIACVHYELSRSWRRRKSHKVVAKRLGLFLNDDGVGAIGDYGSSENSRRLARHDAPARDLPRRNFFYDFGFLRPGSEVSASDCVPVHCGP
jgi:hypothetical protein